MKQFGDSEGAFCKTLCAIQLCDLIASANNIFILKRNCYFCDMTSHSGKINLSQTCHGNFMKNTGRV